MFSGIKMNDQPLKEKACLKTGDLKAITDLGAIVRYYEKSTV